MSGAGCGSRGRQACRTRAARGSTRRSLRTSCQELADGIARSAMQKAWPGTEASRRAEEPPVERREARTSDRKERRTPPRMVSQTIRGVQGGSPPPREPIASARVSRRSAPFVSGECDGHASGANCIARKFFHDRRAGKAKRAPKAGTSLRSFARPTKTKASYLNPSGVALARTSCKVPPLPSGQSRKWPVTLST